MGGVEQSLRLTFRFRIEAWSREADLAVPMDSSLAEVLDDVCRLCDVPEPDSPWQACTSAGLPIDPSVALCAVGLEHGDVVLLEPRKPDIAPIMRDVAEALAHRGTSLSAHSHSPVISALGQGGVVGALVSGPSIGGLLLPHWWLGLAAAAFLGATIVVWRRDAGAVAWTTVLCSGTAIASWISEGESLSLAACTGGTMSGVALAIAGAFLGVRTMSSPRSIACWASATTVAGGAALGWVISRSIQGAGAGGLLATVAIAVGGPWLATSLARVSVPTLPHAGQDLRDVDDEDAPPHSADGPPNPACPSADHTATTAYLFHEGMVVGSSITSLGAFALLAWSGTAISSGMLLGAFVVFGPHALRYANPVIVCTHGFLALATAPAAWLCLFHSGEPHTALVIAVAILTCTITASPLWLARLNQLSPTQTVWVERGEVLAIVVLLPLTVHAMGVFSHIRGWGA